MLLQLLQTILFIGYWMAALMLGIGVIGLIGGITTLLQFGQGDLIKVVLFNLIVGAVLFVIRWGLAKLHAYRFNSN